MMKFLGFTLLLCGVVFSSHAQVSDHFNDGDFSTAPEWSGDDSLFTVYSGQLRLKGSSGEAYLSTAHLLSDTTVWTFFIRQSSNPSTQNFSRFYLTSDQANLKGSLNGYYIQLGGSTGTTDSISLYRQTGFTRKRLIAGRPGTFGRSDNKARVRVKRDPAGNWELQCDTSGNINFVSEGTSQDSQNVSCAYLGWYIRYTQGNSQGYYLDDVIAGKPVNDHTPPAPDSITVKGSNTLQIRFDEALDPVSAIHNKNFLLSPGSVEPISVVLSNDNTVTVTFPFHFTPDVPYHLRVTGISDLSGNITDTSMLGFMYQIPLAGQILISEFMADPEPVNGLPPYEFIELYNNSGKPVSLGGFSISDGNTTVDLPDRLIDKDGFIILCLPAAAPLFAPYGPVIAVPNLLSLNNSGDSIIIRYHNIHPIHSLYYNTRWYHHKEKENGGWSIELQYPGMFCKGEVVYAASVHPAGGTPGYKNSIWSDDRDTTAPKVAYSALSDSKTLLIVTDEPLMLNNFSPSDVDVIPEAKIASVAIFGKDSIIILLQEALPGALQHLFVVHGTADCSGNKTELKVTHTWHDPAHAAGFDVVISEIMADPSPVIGLPDAEYIELFNRSGHVIDLNHWRFSDETSEIILPPFLLFPDSFVVITSQDHAQEFVKNTIGLKKFPSLTNDGEELRIMNQSGQIIHAVSYSSSWFRDAFKQSGGWSLEMIDPENPCSHANWKPSNHHHGGTPGAINSVNNAFPDETPPLLLRAYPLDSVSVRLFFSEPMDSASLHTHNFKLNNRWFPSFMSGDAGHYSSTLLIFDSVLRKDLPYTITVDSITDCAGNSIASSAEIGFTVPYAADSGDLIINEILFNPGSHGVDFVEIYNRSSKAVDLKDQFLCRYDDASVMVESSPLAASGFILYPFSYVAVSPSPEILCTAHTCTYPENIIRSDLPSLNNDAGNLVLMNKHGIVGESLNYNEDMHFKLLDDKEGVSLERIDFNRAAGDRTNWTSAASSAGYATPGKRNSQHQSPGTKGELLELVPEVISPDGDGYHDVMIINYTAGHVGYSANLFIYDASGNMIRQLLKNEPLGVSGSFSWDGFTDSGMKAPVGIYLFYIEAYDLSGKRISEKAVGVVASRL